ncbi:MAG: phage portal protein [Candidatus Lumbricidophila eiseniae]|uniref:Phage portal protein n=1 Tax=Candidatus Lumbricidiphila eiseniae TaxID=1969409 RepID=A0A2A6FN67_9MICO|nr:MAG: phage portal protein [Candidatus Lumbricidophila eiseniae]
MGRIIDWLLAPVPGMYRDTTPAPEVSPSGAGPSDASTAITAPARGRVAGEVSTGDAFSISMVYRAIQIHAIAAKQLSLIAQRNGRPLAQVPPLVRQPDLDVSRSAFIEQSVASLACTGNAYWRKTFFPTGQVANVSVLNPLDVTPVANSAGTLVGYKYRGTDFTPTDVQQLFLLRVPGSLKGLGPIQAAQIELRGALDLRDYSANWFRSSGIPNGLLNSDQELTPAEAQQAKDAWMMSEGALKGVAVLGKGLNYHRVFLSPADAQFLESQQFTTTQIARLFGVPASLMLASIQGSSQTYANIEQDWIGYTRFSLMSYLVEIEDALSALLPRGTRAKFNVEALLRSDTTTRYQAHKIALEAGFMTIDEVRDRENLDPLPQEGL